MLERADRLDERDMQAETMRGAGAFVLADVCRRIVKMPIVSLGGSNGG
ncbi:MAG: hypothetical protein HOW73_34660 [Polyangiaceae bacterium]|nr:hypothetical protein [Polyangiaceae bacterium]